MHKYTAIIMASAIAAVLMTMTSTHAFAYTSDHQQPSSNVKQVAIGGNGGEGGAGGAGGSGGPGGISINKDCGFCHSGSANGGNADGGNGGSANGGSATNVNK